ncbi:MAG: hypothetical protein ACXVB9_21435 [Bdellovibrionota bacterium]
MMNLLFALLAHASPTPCQFSLMPKGYDLGGAYQASFLVVVARTETYEQNKPQTLRVIRVLKGPATLKELTLEGNHINGTDSWGAAITPARDTLVLLSGKDPCGWVDPGSGCPNSFAVEKGSVNFGDKKVKVEDAKKFLEGSPKL